MIRQILRWIAQAGCRSGVHSWDFTILNHWAIPIEERCTKCGEYRWHSLEHHKRGLFNEPEWQVGRHPKVGRAT